MWTKDWMVHCQPVRSGVAALKYLAPYIFRVAISASGTCRNNRILKVEDDQVTFRYKDSDTGETRRCAVTAQDRTLRCPQCGQAMRLVQTLQPKRQRPP